MPITFSIAMNDYGFELLSDQPVPVDDSNVYELFSVDQSDGRYPAKREFHRDGQT
jgi:hypothetical protein